MGKVGLWWQGSGILTVDSICRVRMRYVFLLSVLLCLGKIRGLAAQVSWTPIYVDTTNRLDLWTLSGTGCKCPEGISRNSNVHSNSNDCACCVKPGGCLCSSNPNKCGQCGLQDACQRFCNVSISSRSVATKSGLSWVHLQSPPLEGPTSCWWRLEGAPGQRIEVQIHRLLSVGFYNNATQKCVGGFVQFSEGDTGLSVSAQSIQLCGENSRYSPPIVFFGDHGVATLLLMIDGKTIRSQVGAYVSFSSADDPLVGDPSKGGKLRSHSVCDWLYENCWNHECIIASPGFPGLFPPNRKCRYFIKAKSNNSTITATSTKIRIRFHSISFPQPPLCSSHHVAIWRENGSQYQNQNQNQNQNLNDLGPPWKTLCGNNNALTSLEIEGTEAVLEFRSGSTLSPYHYTGFKASVQFLTSSGPPPRPPPETHLHSPTMSSVTTLSTYKGAYSDLSTVAGMGNHGNSQGSKNHAEEPMGYPRASYDIGSVYPASCGHIFEGDLTRGSVFRLLIPRDLTLPPRDSGRDRDGRSGGGGGLRGFGLGSFGGEPKLPPLPGIFKCQLEFRGKPSDVVQLALFSYKFRGRNCSTIMEVYDMSDTETNYTDRLLGKLCGPSGVQVKSFTSSHNRLALVILVTPYEDPLGTEFLEGAFRFHDETVEGTVKPMSSCEVVYYGVTSLSVGQIVGPPSSPLLRLSTFPLVCAHTFQPSPNQSVQLTFDRAGHDSANVALPGSRKYCRTFCSSSGCRCEAKYTPLSHIDHLQLVSAQTPISCLCGFFPDILPLTFESETPLMLVYHATKGGHEFSYSAKFHFQSKVTCANFTIQPPSGSRRWRDILGPAILNPRRAQHYTYFHCVWPISVPLRYKLTLDFVSEENEQDCRTWNLTLWTESGKAGAVGSERSDLVAFFCPKQGRQEIKVPDSVHNAYVRLSGVTLRPPQFELRWKYVDVIFGSGLQAKKISSGSPSNLSILNRNWVISICLLFCSKIFQRFCTLSPSRS